MINVEKHIIDFLKKPKNLTKIITTVAEYYKTCDDEVVNSLIQRLHLVLDLVFAHNQILTKETNDKYTDALKVIISNVKNKKWSKITEIQKIINDIEEVEDEEDEEEDLTHLVE